MREEAGVLKLPNSMEVLVPFFYSRRAVMGRFLRLARRQGTEKKQGDAVFNKSVLPEVFGVLIA